MEITIHFRSDHEFGGHPCLALVADFFQRDLPELEGIQQIDTVVFFRGARRAKGIEGSRFESFLLRLPTAKLLEKKGRIELSILSGLEAGAFKKHPFNLALFQKIAAEVGQGFQLMQSKCGKLEQAQVDRFLRMIGEKLAQIPSSQEAFEILLGKLEKRQRV